jgi:CheY-like chemotaxis protein
MHLDMSYKLTILQVIPFFAPFIYQYSGESTMRRRRALVFDDEPLILDLLRQYLSSLGYDVVAASEPVICPLYAENAKTCPRQAPCADILITDSRMPAMNGLEFLRALTSRGCRLKPGNRALLSGYLDGDSVTAAKKMGCAFFDKPINFLRLETWITGCDRRIDLTQPLGDRRREDRIPLSGQQPCHVRCANDSMECSTMDVSENGFCLALPLPLEREQLVHVASLSAAAPPRAAFVRWTRRQQDGFYRTGLSCR